MLHLNIESKSWVLITGKYVFLSCFVFSSSQSQVNLSENRPALHSLSKSKKVPWDGAHTKYYKECSRVVSDFLLVL